MKIEIVTAPNGHLEESGYGSLKACQLVLASIDKRTHTTRLSECHNESDLNKVVHRKADLLMLAVKYIQSKDEKKIWLSDFFSSRNINFTGSTRKTLALDSNKIKAKLHLRSFGVKTADYFLVPSGDFCEMIFPVAYPLFMKAIDAANGNGVDENSKVTNFVEFKKKSDELSRRFHGQSMAEKYLSGREFTVSIISMGSSKFDEHKIGACEIIPPKDSKGNRILSEKVKNENSESLIKIDDQDLRQRIIELAFDSFKYLGIRDFGRIDIKMERNELFFIEANMVPGLGGVSSYFPRALLIDRQLSYGETIGKIIETASKRFMPNEMKYSIQF